MITIRHFISKCHLKFITLIPVMSCGCKTTFVISAVKFIWSKYIWIPLQLEWISSLCLLPLLTLSKKYFYNCMRYINKLSIFVEANLVVVAESSCLLAGRTLTVSIRNCQEVWTLMSSAGPFSGAMVKLFSNVFSQPPNFMDCIISSPYNYSGDGRLIRVFKNPSRNSKISDTQNHDG